MTRKYSEGDFVICGGSDQFWEATNARTLKGAKRAATDTYQVSVGGKIEIAEVVGEGDLQRFEKVAIKHGHNRWTTAE